MDDRALDKMLDGAFGRNQVTEDEMLEWINTNAFQIMTTAYPGSRELLEELDEYTYEDVLEALLTNSYGDALLETYIREHINWIQDESERSMNRKRRGRR